MADAPANAGPAPVVAKAPRGPRASTSSKNRTERSPSPYRSRNGQSTSEFINEFWQHTINVAETIEDDFKHQALPLARIKKVMKIDPDVKMISSEVSIVLEKACQIFIQELTARAHLVSIASGRRTLSRPDVAKAISNSDMYDFLVDIVAREDVEEPAKAPTGAGRKRKASTSAPKEGKEKGKKGKGKKKAKVEEMSDEAWSEEEEDNEVDYEAASPKKQSKRAKRKTRPAKSVSYDQESLEDELAEEALIGGGAEDVVGEAETPAVAVPAGPTAPAPFMTSSSSRQAR